MSAVPSAPHPARQPLGLACALRATPELSRRQKLTLVTAMAALHGAGLWALLQVPAVRAVVQQVAPMMVDLVVPDTPEPPAPPPPPPPPPTARPLTPPPPAPAILAAPATEPVPTAAFTAPAPPTVPVVAEAPAAPTAPPVPPAPPAPPQRRVVAASAVRYTVLPPVEVPRASRRAGEHGTVWLRVVVSVQGTPQQVSVQRSSGFMRLDEQALWAMRQARFKPHTEDGHAIEVEVTAPIEYPEE